MTMPLDLDAEILALEQHLAEPEYTAEDLAHAELLLRASFWPVPEESGAGGMFGGGRPKRDRDESLYRSKPRPGHFQELGYPEGITSAWATRVHASASSRAHFSRPPIPDSAINTPRIHSIVNSLSEPHLVLIRAEFMRPSPMRAAFAVRLLRMVWDDYAPRVAPGLNRWALTEMARAVVATAGRPEKYFALQLRDRLEITKSNWWQRYAPHWRALLANYEQRRHAALSAFLDEN